MERSSLLEAADQLNRALVLIETLPPTPALRREQIKLQVALITPLLHVSGYAAPETRAAVERARLLIEQAEALGEPPEDPLLLFSVLYGHWAASFVAFDGNRAEELAARFLTLAQEQEATVPLMIGHRLMGSTLMVMGEIAAARVHHDQALALYNPSQHRPVADRFSQDTRVTCLSFRSLTLLLLGYPEAALADIDQGLTEAREISQASAILYALSVGGVAHIFCGNYSVAGEVIDELMILADDKGAMSRKAWGMAQKGYLLALAGRPTSAVEMMTSGLHLLRSTGWTLFAPWIMSWLAGAYADLGRFDDAWRCTGEAMTAMHTSKEALFEADIHRVGGEIALKSSVPDAAKAEAYFERALAVARKQQAKSWELRAATSMARLWRDQGKRDEARELLAPVYGWFTEGFDTVDLKQAKVLLDELAA